MPAIQTTANTAGSALWNEAKHKKAELLGLTVDNKGTAPNTIKLYDCFIAVSGKWASGGAARNQEDFSTNVLSGKVRAQLTVPAGETHKLSEDDTKETNFLGKVYAVAGVTDANCVIIAQYRLR